MELVRELKLYIDPSYSNTGVTIEYDDNIYFREFKGLKPKIGKKGQELKSGAKSDIKTWFRNFSELLQSFPHTKLIIYYGIMGSSVNHRTSVNLGKLVGLMELTADEIYCENENSIRKAVLGKGQGKKEIMKKLSVANFEKDLGYLVSDDIADSYTIYKYFNSDNYKK